ncbi:MAG: hypothetical protein DRQ10_05780 [Candidatus Hydrothermota bacterium]|nr:MAG: hypothetical protein DRQ10_05780 [Candidatus Hydrothermae bacterium]
MRLAFFALFSYVLGSFPTAYLIGKWFKGIDIRKVGSKNMGTVNTFKNVGPIAGVIVAIVDVSKGLIPAILVGTLGFPKVAYPIAGAAVVAGHNWSIFMKFNGGQGLATAAGFLFALMPYEVLIAIALGAVGVVLLKMLGIGGWFKSPKNRFGFFTFSGLTCFIALRPHESFSRIAYLVIVVVLTIRQIECALKGWGYLRNTIVECLKGKKEAKKRDQ